MIDTRIKTRLFLAILIFFVAGCTAAGKKQKPATWIDMEDLSSGIVKPSDRSVGQEKGAAQDEAGKTGSPKSKALSMEGGKDNPQLAAILERGKSSKGKEPGAGQAAAGEGVLLNFDNADIYEFIHAMSQVLNLNYIIDPSVKGVVNVRSAQKIEPDQLFQIFKKILNINGLDIRSEGAYYYILTAQKPSSLIVQGPEGIGDLKDSPRVVTQVVPVLFAAAAEMSKLIQPYLSDRGMIFEVPNHNTLIISAFESKVIDALQILALIDISPLATMNARMVRVEKASLFDLRDELTEIFTAMNINQKDLEGITSIPLERTNSLLLISHHAYLVDNAENWIKELDVVPSEGRDDIYIYNVRNSVASDLAELLNEILYGASAGGRTTGQGKKGLVDKKQKTSSATSPSSSKSRTTSKSQQDKASKSLAKKSPTSPAGADTAAAMRLAGEAAIIADDNRNIIIIKALPADYPRIIKLIEKLDNMPTQVLIEVLVAEVTLTDAWEFGIEWWLKEKTMQSTTTNADGTTTTTTTPYGIGTNLANVAQDLYGLTYSFLSDNEKVFGLLHALASNSDVNILSSPQIMVLNNETATINVGREVPIVTSESAVQNVVSTPTSATTGTSSGTVDKTVEYKDVGVILEATPKINANGIIILEISQQVSEARKNTVSGIDSPEILKREIQTTLAVKDGQSILMGGLISKSQDTTDSGVPYLKDLPYLGWFFKSQQQSTTKTELLIMITPHVIESEDVLDQYVNNFRKKVTDIREQLQAEPQ